MKKSTLLLISFIISANLLATTVTWTGASNNQWSEKTNWSTSALPESGDDVIISGTVNCLRDINDGVILNSLVIDGNRTLTIGQNIELEIGGQSLVGVKINGGCSVIVEGHLYVNDHEGDGIVNNGTLTNNELITVFNSDAFSTATGRGILTEGLLTNNDQINITGCDGRGFDNVVTVINNDDIEIKSFTSTVRPFSNEGSFTNAIGSKLEIDNVAGSVAFFNESAFTNRGMIIIDNAYNGLGIQNEDVLDNYGSIIISDVTYYGIKNRATADFNGYANSSISVENVDNNTSITLPTAGILNEGFFEQLSNSTLSIFNISGGVSGSVSGIQNTSTLNNSGSISIDSITGDSIFGIKSFGTFSHLDSTIHIEVVDGQNPVGIFNAHQFINSLGANIIIENIETFSPTFDTSYAIVNSNNADFFTNQGKIELMNVEDFGILNQSTFTNSDSISIFDFDHGGIINDHIFNNLPNTFLSIDNNCLEPCSSSTGIKNSNIVNNMGEIKTESLTRGYEGAYLTNSGSLMFNKSPIVTYKTLKNSGLIQITEASTGIINSDSIINLDGGIISIDSTSNNFLPTYGILNEVNSTLINHGKIELRRCKDDAIVSSGRVVNHDTIILENLASSNGYINEVNGQLINESTGLIKIKNVGTSYKTIISHGGVDNDGQLHLFNVQNTAITNHSIWDNYGTIRADSLESGTTERGLYNTTTGIFTNRGTMDFNEYTFVNQADFINRGMLNIDNHGGNAIDNKDSLFNTTVGTINIGNQSHPNLSSKGAIDNNGYFSNENIINIGIVEGMAINNISTFLNKERITISKANVGIKNTDLFTNESGANIIADTISKFSKSTSWFMSIEGTAEPFMNYGLLQVDSCDHGALDIIVPFYNFSNIIINNIPNQAIRAVDSFYNAPPGNIDISNVSSVASGSAVFSSVYFKNEGDMTISNSSSQAIQTNGVFENHGTLNFSNVNNNSLRISNLGSFKNFGTGIIDIDNNTHLTASCIFNQGRFTNDNIIDIDNVAGIGITSRGYFENNKTIDINGVGTGFMTSDSLINNASAKIDINIVTASHGFINEDDGFVPNDDKMYIVNYGEIEVSNVMQGDGISNEGDLINYNIVDIDAIDMVNSHAIFNEGRILNTSSADIDINNVDSGIDNDGAIINDGEIKVAFALQNGISTSDSLINNNLIDINRADSIGLIIKTKPFGSNLSRFENNAGALTHINSSWYGMEVEGRLPSQTSVVNNNGRINLQKTHGYALEVEALGFFENMDTLYIEDYELGIYNNNEINNATGSYVQMVIHQGDGIEENAINNIKNITNHSCAEWHVEGPILNDRPSFSSPALFTNEGFILQSSRLYDNQIIDTLINNGVYVDVNGASTDVGKIKSEGMYTSPIMGAFLCGNTVNGFYNGNGIGILGGMLTIDKNGNTSAGTIDVSTNTLILNSGIENVDTLWAQLSQNGSCNKVIPLIFETTITCEACGTNTWTGNGSDNNWFTSGNWSLGLVPASCQNVIIPNGATCNIPPAMTGECALIEVNTGASFQVDGLLNVFGN